MEQFPPETFHSNEPLTSHRWVEAMRFAYGARLKLGDPDFVEGVGEFEGRMLEEGRARETWERIWDNRTQPVENYLPVKEFLKESHGTSHIATADDEGMATSLTTTVNLLFGNLIVEPKTGIILNNEMNDFSIPGEPNEFGFPPSPANFIAPLKRPLSSCTPMIITSSNTSTSPFLATLGAGGGSRIISSTAQVLWHLVEHELSLQEAISHPRLHDQLMPNVTLLEVEMKEQQWEDVVEGLVGRGHEVLWVEPVLSAVQGVVRGEDGEFAAVGETRQKNSGGLTL